MIKCANWSIWWFECHGVWLWREYDHAGSWNAPDNIRQFGSALTLVHVSSGHSDSYSEACPDCVISKTEDRMTDQKLCDFIKFVFAEKSAYVQKGDSAELLQVRNKLCSSNSLGTFNFLQGSSWGLSYSCAQKKSFRLRLRASFKWQQSSMETMNFQKALQL